MADTGNRMGRKIFAGQDPKQAVVLQAGWAGPFRDFFPLKSRSGIRFPKSAIDCAAA
jgi:hypothetical protein